MATEPPIPQIMADPQAALAAARMRLEHQFRGGANWFYWIAGLSLVNSMVQLSGSDWRFIVGLGITQIVDYIGTQAGTVGTVAALVIDVFAAGVFVLFGVFARKSQRWAFLVGMVLYGLDGLLLMLGPDFLGLAFHGFALYQIFRGLTALKGLEQMGQPGVVMPQEV